MINTQNIENDVIFTMESLDLNFSKKKQRKSSVQPCSATERKNKGSSTIQIDQLRTDRSVLVEKKKNYSEAIRQRNLNLILKKKNDSVCLPKNNENTIQSKGLAQIKQNMTEQLKKQKKFNSTRSKRSQKQNLKISSQKKSYINMSALDLQPIPFSHQFQYKCFNQTAQIPKQLFSYDLKNSDQFSQQKNQKLKLCSKEVNQQIMVFDSDTTILVKQNATFKRDLANYRKQNSLLKKQLQEAKDHISELEQKTKNILQGSLLNSVKLSLEPTEEPINSTNDNNLQIIQKLRQEILGLRNLNSNLQLKVYMAQKKVVEEVASCKKKLAKQLHQWRDKCTKLRAENYKFKTFKDMTLSMEISKDEQ